MSYNPIQDLTEIQILETLHAVNFNHLYVQFKTEAKKRTEWDKLLLFYAYLL